MPACPCGTSVLNIARKVRNAPCGSFVGTSAVIFRFPGAEIDHRFSGSYRCFAPRPCEQTVKHGPSARESGRDRPVHPERLRAGNKSEMQAGIGLKQGPEPRSRGTGDGVVETNGNINRNISVFLMRYAATQGKTRGQLHGALPRAATRTWERRIHSQRSGACPLANYPTLYKRSSERCGAENRDGDDSPIMGNTLLLAGGMHPQEAPSRSSQGAERRAVRERSPSTSAGRPPFDSPSLPSRSLQYTSSSSNNRRRCRESTSSGAAAGVNRD